MSTIEAPRSEVSSKNSASVPAPSESASTRESLVSSIRHLLGDKQSVVTFGDLRDAARSLGVSAKRKTDGTVASVDALDRAIFLVLFARFVGHANVTKGQLFELAGISRTMNEDGAKGPDGALYVKDGQVRGDSATLGTMKVRPSGKIGNVVLD